MVHLVAGACGSTGWLTAHLGAASRLLDAFEKDVRADLIGPEGAAPPVAFTLEPGGRLTETEDGLRLDGRWTAVTGAAYAGHLILAARRRGFEAPGPLGVVLVPIESCRVAPAIDTIGLTAIGSLDVAVEGVAVPEEHWCEVDGLPSTTTAPVGAVVAMALVGAAHGALDTHVAQVAARVALSHGGEEVRTGDLSPTKVGRAASLLDAAALLLAGDVDTDPDGLPQDRLEHQVYAVNRSVQAAELVFSSMRTHALDADDPVARLWRDVRVGGDQARTLTTRLRSLGG
ncbi:acyl-CoA dehydrogenase family protein [Nocardioides sambongensis]|uniref:hypothetical protein n=1 Tax=Nocardioides sambongensis TaxID=2589074 RepID=UPI0015E86E3B|nr:hypothetical protein [Nocardioides sambongensis]